MGIRETILLSGASEVVARKIGEIAQVDRVISRCPLQDKVRIVKELVELGYRVLMASMMHPPWQPPRWEWRWVTGINRRYGCLRHRIALDEHSTSGTMQSVWDAG